MEKNKIESQKITPCLWFNGNAEEAVHFYVSVFKNSKIEAVSHYGKNMPMPEGTVLTVVFLLEGQEFLALNGGPEFTFSEAISFVVNCETQQEIDVFWSKLSDGGQIQQCGWLKDKFGVSWQIVPIQLGKMLQNKDPEKSQRVLQEIMQMIKIDIEKLETAYNAK
jgi:predicted 3-demethylubiquinone-9 3-methyltransferase (glyoxalase superfamily)